MKRNILRNFALRQAMNYLEKNIPRLMNMVDKSMKGGSYEVQRNLIRRFIEKKGSWYELMLKIYELDPNVRKTVFENFLINDCIDGYAYQTELSKKYGCNIPWAVLLDPTSACNLHCKGCWTAEYGNKLNLSLETIDSIIRQGKELGCYMYIYTGGEPLVRKNDLIKICEMHPDCEFLSFTNGTLIDEEFCREMPRVKTLSPR